MLKKVFSILKYFFFFLFVLSIPWQKRHIFFNLPIKGEFNEWTAISIYVSDIFLFLSLIFWAGQLIILKIEKTSKIITPLTPLIRGGDFSPDKPACRSFSVGRGRARGGSVQIWHNPPPPASQAKALRAGHPPLSRRGQKILVTSYQLLATLLIIASFSLIQAQYINIAIFRLAKLLEMILLFTFVVSNFGKLKKRQIIYALIIITAFTQGVIAISQYLLQHSLGLNILGESPIAANIVGVAKIVVNNEKIIRAYGTFPHPNVLAGFLILPILLCFYFWGRLQIWKENNQKTLVKLLLIISEIILIISFILTFSRSAWFVLTLGIIVFIWINYKKLKPILPGAVILFLTVIITIIILWPQITSRGIIADSSSGDFALSNRTLLNKIALSIIASHPLLGIGIGNFVLNLNNFIPNMPAWRFQPVHNLYLYYAAEIGIPGLLIFLSIIWVTLKKAFKYFKSSNEILILLITLSSFLIIGFLDHYFYDLQQGMLIFWLILGLIWTVILQKYKNIV